ncbi:glycosyltransferase family 2 protein [Gordonia sputi]
MTIAVLIVNFYSSSMVATLLSDLSRQKISNKIVVSIADNSQNDAEYSALQEATSSLISRFRAINVTRCDINAGYASGNQVAFQAIPRRCEIDYVLVINPDVSIVSGELNRLTEALETSARRTIAVAETITATGTSSGTAAISKLTGRSRNLGVEEKPSRAWLVYPAGHFMAMTRELWEEVGGLDVQYFLYGEEADLVLRSGIHRENIRRVPSVTISHVGGATTNSGTKKSQISLYHSTKSRVLLYRRHSSLRRYLPVMIIIRLAYATRLMANGVGGCSVARGVIAGLRHPVSTGGNDAR